MADTSELRRRQLDRFYKELKKINLKRPKEGWVKEVRSSLGMSLEDLGKRLGTIKQRIQAIEKSELDGKVTVESLQKTAEAMGCDFIYFIVPKESLEKVIETQAEIAARSMLSQVDKTMKLEKQGMDSNEQKQAIDDMKKKILSEKINKIWKLK
ncbi:MAG: mobile mystery protein A [Bdellovibrionales bacterium]|nr:mobile mystery protein A [Bdellovibrionales bacterium]